MIVKTAGMNRKLQPKPKEVHKKNSPGILSEGVFLSNRRDLKLLAQPPELLLSPRPYIFQNF